MEGQLQRALRAWRDNLIDLTGRNRLLNFRHTTVSTLEIREPGLSLLLDRLPAGWRFAELPEDEDGDLPRSGGLVTQKTTQPKLDASLRRLYRDSNRIFNDTGLWVLQLGTGFLEWREPGGDGPSRAPLMLYPVRLERIGPGVYRLRQEEGEDPVPNPALAVKMEHLGLAWPPADDIKDFDSAMEAVRTAVAGQPGWEITDDVVLATFRSHKEAMYRDLRDNEHVIRDHPMVQVVALGPDAELTEDALAFDPVDLGRIDELRPPELTPLVLDADSSQRQCVEAALDGQSFVMDGPPGTGKSQTIANMIAALMGAGKSVLFVSEKAAALDVVHNRLAEVGLDSYLLSLHSHHATRREVATELGRTLDQRPAARLTVRDNQHKLTDARLRLSAYATAMNEVRQPLCRSLHEVIGRVDVLAGGGIPLLTTGLPDDLDARALDEILRTAEKIGDAWRPVAEGAEFCWHGLAADASPQASLRYLAERTGALDNRVQRHSELRDPLGLDVDGLITLLEATRDRPPVVPPHWLTADLGPLKREVAEFTKALRRIRTDVDRLKSEAGAQWDELDETLPSVAPAPDLAVAAVDAGPLTPAQARQRAAEFEAAAAMLTGARATLADIAAAHGMPAPETADAAVDLCELTEFNRAEARPEAAWLRPDGHAAACHAADTLEAGFERLGRVYAGELFSTKVLTDPGFPEAARIFLQSRKLSGRHRSAKSYLATMTASGEWRGVDAAKLRQALDWRSAEHAQRQAIADHSSVLGRYWKGQHTDFRLVREALANAQRIIQLARGLPEPHALAAQVTAGAVPDPALCETARGLREELHRWRAYTGSTLGRPALSQLPLAQVADWHSAQLVPLRTAAQFTEAVQPACATDPALTLVRARELAGMIGAARTEIRAFAAQAGQHRELLGELYDGLGTEAVERTLRWVESVRVNGRAMPAEALLRAQPDPGLAKLRDEWLAAVRQFAGLFVPERREELFEQLAVRPSPLAERLMADTEGPDEWRQLAEGRAVLGRYGLADLVDRAAEVDLVGTRFRAAVEAAVLQTWIEHHLASDGRLQPFSAQQRDRLVGEFRALDQTLVRNARGRIIDACNARRPAPHLGQAAVLKRESQKKRGHMPVRLLLERARDVMPLLKPCFMMSPLTVSQFLPPDYRFDVVIFDEASQVYPEDAINCIYRSGALIVAGDQRQLPPTNFFAVSEDDDDEYDEEAPDAHESLLDMCKASGLIQSLPLRWHYRSQHEDLIAFSNAEFYEWALTTFPGALQSGDDVGVHFTKVHGVYDRGRSRRNEIEAKAVADRVMHHVARRPSVSVGVVAMSEAQAQAIEDAVDEARRLHPELDAYFTQDRLDGFFVKNLETVQGDERDVMILSVGYGPDTFGKLSMTFGPLNRENGWRRLNVAITRARRRVEVVASILSADIRESDNASRTALKRYLEFAENGARVLPRAPGSPDTEPESPFEESVLSVLQGWGYEVDPQVGVAGYRIDLGVRHPESSGRYAIGIECDGAMYHSSHAARDRDRLREQVLRGLGWKLHRIWSTDWYRYRPQAEQRLREAVEKAIADGPRPADVPELSGEPPRAEELPADGVGIGAATDEPDTDRAFDVTAEPVTEVPVATEEPVVTMEPVSETGARHWAVPYQRARLTPSWLFQLHDAMALPEIYAQLRHVIEVEAPIHKEVLCRRITDAWEKKLGSQIRANIDTALRKVLGAEDWIVQDGDILKMRGRKIIPRTHADGVRRKIPEIPPEERRQAMLHLLEESPGISENDLITATVRFFDWHSTRKGMTQLLSKDLNNLAADGLIEIHPNRIVLRSTD